MARIVMADDGIHFDGRTPENAPIGGAESAFIGLAHALAARGHEVIVRNNCEAPLNSRGVDWAPLAPALEAGDFFGDADLYIANRGHTLISLLPRARRRIFWIHNPARYLLKLRYLWPLLKWHPEIVFSGRYHAASCPFWVPVGGRHVIPYGISEVFRTATPLEIPPPPRVVFTSNPMRSLNWLLDLWVAEIRPQVPDAELHIFSGARTYGAVGNAKAVRMASVLERARSLGDAGVVLRDPVAKPALATVLANSRVLLYRGDVGETFCLAVGEAQAVGVPAVVQDIGCVAERVVDGVTGAVATDDADFIRHAVALLHDDDLWRSQHNAALQRQRGWGWDEAAAAFE
ncbi:MAG: glycosyltransferase family 4 protein, partial [Alphaproteobacteria bacterium]|nr:glycosyltransferase family 4 protein [Alphaproteobacteria bacterium]